MSQVFLIIAQISLSSSLLIAACLLLMPVLRKQFSACWRRLLWLMIALRLLIPMALPLPADNGEAAPAALVELTVPAYLGSAEGAMPEEFANISVRWDTAGELSAAEISNDAAAPVQQEPIQPAATANTLSGFHLTELASWVWLAGMALFWGWQVGKYCYFRRRLQRWRRPYYSSIMQQAAEELHCKRPLPRLYISSGAPSPMVIGFRRPCIYLPQPYEGEQLYYILRHELIHWQRHDIWFKLLWLLARGVHWFNPLVHLASRNLEQDLEMACDERVIADFDSSRKNAYSQSILNCIDQRAGHTTPLSTCFNGGVKIMKQRFCNIFSPITKKRGRLALVISLLLVVAAGGVFGCTIKDEPAEPAGIQAADEALILYGVSSQATSITSPDIIALLLDMYSDLKLEPASGEEMDPSHTYTISFSRNGVSLISWNVDSSGLCYIVDGDGSENADLQIYRIVSDSFDPELLRLIYNGTYDELALLNQDWQQICIRINEMDNAERKAILEQPVADGTPVQIAKQLVKRFLASWNYDPGTDGDYDSFVAQSDIIDTQITRLELVEIYNQGSSDPLYLYELDFRLLPEDPAKVVLAGGMDLDDDGWVTGAGNGYSRLLLGDNGQGAYTFMGNPAFDLPRSLAVLETIYGENANTAFDFSMTSEKFIFVLGQLLGHRVDQDPWSSADPDSDDSWFDPEAVQKLSATDMPGADFYRVPIAGLQGVGGSELVWYQIRDSGLQYIYSLTTTDPYVSIGFAGQHHARVGMTESELLASWGDVLQKADHNRNEGIYLELDWDSVYNYTASFSNESGISTWEMNFLVEDGKLAGAEMYMVLQ